MEERFALKRGLGGDASLTLFEQADMTAEERAWWVNKLQTVADEERKRADQR